MLKKTQRLKHVDKQIPSLIVYEGHSCEILHKIPMESKVVIITSKLIISYNYKLHSKAIIKDVKSNIKKLGDARIKAVCVTSV